MKRLPIGIQSFQKIRSDNFYYVDKTPYVKRLVEEGGGYFFLARPRRFGKSLFLDTLRQAFLGKRELFEGLFLQNNWNWDTTYPVIHISFGAGVYRNIEELRDTLESLLIDWKNEFSIRYEKKSIKDRFNEAIVKISEGLKQRVVVLIDEYDKPILDNIERRDVAQEIRDELKNFYSVLKDADPYLKFVFITGVTKFSKVSIFSGLNNLNDITLDESYAAICGYTQEELELVFKERLEGISLEEVKMWYNGYSWGNGTLYNPFDILLFLDKKRFRPYWFETGTPTFLIRLLQERRYFIPDLEHLEASERIIGSFDIDYLDVETLLFQTGYLTIKDMIKIGDRENYLLGYPNLEVRMSLTDYILDFYVRNASTKEKNIIKFYKALSSNVFARLKEIFHAFFASIPHDWYRKNQLLDYEGYYASIFYCYFTALGLDVRVEDSTNHGRLDMAVVFEGKRVYIFEFKVKELAPDGQALAQLKEKKYHEKYMGNYQEIYLVGVEFSREERNIIGFEVEEATS